MSDGKFTPGPWHVMVGDSWPHGMKEKAVTSLDVCGGAPQPGFEGNCICSVSPIEVATETDKANARLIAAAPELLRACQALLACGSFAKHGPEAEKAAQLAVSAIHRAQGDE